MTNTHLSEHSFPGIYLITCISNNKRYVGSSKNIYQRIRRHLSDLRKNNHPNPIFQNSFNKYKEQNFKCFILEKLNVENDLIKREKYWINLLKPEMNINDPEYIVFNDSTKKQISETLKKYYKENPPKTKPYTLFNLDGSIYKVYNSITEAAKDIGIKSDHSIRRAIKNSYIPLLGRFQVRQGHCIENIEPFKRNKKVWKNKTQYEDHLKYVHEQSVKKRLLKSEELRNILLRYPDNIEEIKNNIKKGKKNPVLQFDLKGNFMAWFQSYNQASVQTGIHSECIRLCAIGKLITGGNYIWKNLFN